jgi:catechol 2,3-dioxygenase-like lactoylglutathione lyase family enzyme
MKIKSVSGITCYVKDLKKTAVFYEMLGFEIKKKEAGHVKMYSNWFWIDFVPISKETKSEFQKEAQMEHKGGGLYVYLSVDSVDQVYKELLAKGFKPSSEPRDWPWGNREFVIRDPDGYKLVFFQKK